MSDNGFTCPSAVRRTCAVTPGLTAKSITTSQGASICALGLSREAFQGKPVIGICNSFSEINTCNAHLRQVAEAVKRGVWVAGGFPLEFPVMSLGEQYMKLTTMLFRNLMAMDVEKSIRANPRIVKKLDLAENTRYCQAGFEDAMPMLRGDFFVM